MAPAAEAFGRTREDEAVALHRLTRGALELELVDYGATVHALRYRGRPMTLALPRLADYEADTRFIGPVVGRVANRIGRARFPLDGRTVEVSANEGANTLHGGLKGWNKRMWRPAPQDDGHALVLAYASPAEDEGFPGRVHAQARFSLEPEDTLKIAYTAATDAPTAVAMTHHLYFNLSGEAGRTVLDHRLTIAADAITPVGPGLITTGALQDVAGGPFDLRGGKRVGDVLATHDPQLSQAGGLDHNFALRGGAPALTLASPESGVTMTLTTDQPGIQVYGGHGLGAPFVRFGALAIEPQGFPDAVNHRAFPSAILRPGETYRRVARYRFGEAG